MLQAGIKRGIKGEIPDDGGNAKGIRADHKANNNDNEPFKGSRTVKAGGKG